MTNIGHICEEILKGSQKFKHCCVDEFTWIASYEEPKQIFAAKRKQVLPYHCRSTTLSVHIQING